MQRNGTQINFALTETGSRKVERVSHLSSIAEVPLVIIKYWMCLLTLLFTIIIEGLCYYRSQSASRPNRTLS
jgi:hypothetical protein